MTGRTPDTAGSRPRALVDRRGRRRARLPDKIGVACPPGTCDRIERAAAHDGVTPAEWLRTVLRMALEAARKRQAGS